MTCLIQDLFSHCFVINVTNERLLAFKQRFAKEQLPIPKIFRGFQYKNGVYKSAGIVKTSNAANVRLSNLAIVKTAEALDWPFVCIFEDDAKPCINAKQKLENSLQYLPDDIDMLKLGWLCQKNKHAVDNHFCKAETFGSHAYVIFRKYYQMFQNIATKFFCTDVDAMNDNNYNILCTNELLFMQDDRNFKIECVHPNNSRFFHELSSNGQLSSFEC